MNEAEAQLRLTALHEAGHVVAALHYGCPFGRVTIAADGPKLGATQLGVSKPTDAVVIFCGPLAEKPWTEFYPGAPIDIRTVGADHEALLYLDLTRQAYQRCLVEAAIFLSKPEVQHQIDRVAGTLLERGTLSPDEVREVASFTQSLASVGWRGEDVQ